MLCSLFKLGSDPNLSYYANSDQNNEDPDGSKFDWDPDRSESPSLTD